MSLITEKKDLLTVFGGIKEKSFVDSNKVVLTGESMGGAVTDITAPEVSFQIAGEILLYPALMINDNVLETYMRFDRIPDEVAQNGIVMTREKFYRDIKDMDLT